MTPDFLHHLRHNWPLALVVVGLAVYLPVVLIRGVVITNQGSIRRSQEPERFRSWVRTLVVLLVVAAAALVGTYFLDPSK
jgi:Mn2+/Fe2+ NRAMP family transporter